MDYGLAMKSDSGLLLTKHFALLFRLNLMFRQKNAYTGAMLMHMLILMYQRKNKLPMWKMYTISANVFNEEVGEMSLAVLGRVTLGDTLKSDFEYMNKMYSLQHQYRAVAEDTRKDAFRKKRNPHNHYMADKRVLAQAKVTAFMLDAIVKIEAGTYRVYTGKPDKDNPAYKGKAVASTSTRMEPPPGVMPLWIGHSANEKDVGRIMATVQKKAVKKYCQDWGMKIVTVWPEMGNVPLWTGKKATIAAAADRASMIANHGVHSSSDSEESKSDDEMSSEPEQEIEDLVPSLMGYAAAKNSIDEKHNSSDDDLAEDLVSVLPAKRKRAKPKGGG